MQCYDCGNELEIKVEGGEVFMLPCSECAKAAQIVAADRACEQMCNDCERVDISDGDYGFCPDCTRIEPGGDSDYGFCPDCTRCQDCETYSIDDLRYAVEEALMSDYIVDSRTVSESVEAIIRACGLSR